MRELRDRIRLAVRLLHQPPLWAEHTISSDALCTGDLCNAGRVPSVRGYGVRDEKFRVACAIGVERTAIWGGWQLRSAIPADPIIANV
jgi:hypothetical protein